MAQSGGSKKLGRNKDRCARYAAARKYERNRDRRAKARAKRVAKRGAEMAATRAAKALASHRRRHLLKHGLPAVETCATCAGAAL